MYYGLEPLIVIGGLCVVGGSIIRLIMSICGHNRIKSMQQQLDRMERALMKKTVCHETEVPKAAEAPLEQIKTLSHDAIAEIVGETKTPPPEMPAPAPVPAPALPPQPHAFEPTTFERAIAKAWNWFTIGEDFRKPGESWEYAAATHWLLRLGILTVLAGVAFFLKYSIDTGMMGPLGRVSLSLLAGIVLIVGGVCQFFKKYHLLGQGLAGMGFIMLYFAFFAASFFYHLMSEPAAFALLVCVTAGAGVLAVRYRSFGIAMLGMIGGYATPVMIETTTAASAWFFYAYVLLLGVGIFGISMMRRWPLLNVFGMLAAYGLAFLYSVNHHDAARLFNDLIFLSAIHLLFLGSVVVFHLRKRLVTGAVEWAAIFLNAGIYWVWMFLLFNPVYGKTGTGMVALAVSAVYVALVYLCFRRKLVDQMVTTLFILLAAIFLAMSPVLMLSADWLTLAWCLQALAMLYVSRQTGQAFLGKAAVALFALASLRGMVIDLGRIYNIAQPWALTGTAFWQSAGLRLLIYGALPASLTAAWRMLREHRHASKILGLVLLQVLLYFTLEADLIAHAFLPGFREGAVTLAWTLFAFTLLFAGIRLRGQWLRWAGLGLFALTLGKLLMFDLSELATLYRIIAFISTGVVLVLGAFVYLKYKNLFDAEGNAVSEGMKE